MGLSGTKTYRISSCPQSDSRAGRGSRLRARRNTRPRGACTGISCPRRSRWGRLHTSSKLASARVARGREGRTNDDEELVCEPCDAVDVCGPEDGFKISSKAEERGRGKVYMRGMTDSMQTDVPTGHEQIHIRSEKAHHPHPHPLGVLSLRDIDQTRKKMEPPWEQSAEVNSGDLRKTSLRPSNSASSGHQGTGVLEGSGCKLEKDGRAYRVTHKHRRWASQRHLAIG
jgi:hypothetical protein